MLAPNRAGFYLEWGDAYLVNGHAAEAILHYERAFALGAWSPRLYANYSQALRITGRITEADAAYNTYRRLIGEPPSRNPK